MQSSSEAAPSTAAVGDLHAAGQPTSLSAKAASPAAALPPQFATDVPLPAPEPAAAGVALPTLVQHLLDIGAPRAAARLTSGREAATATAAAAASVSVPPSVRCFEMSPADTVVVVADLGSATAFCKAVAAAVAAAHDAAFDAEWRPDSGGSDHSPSLVQVAIRPTLTSLPLLPTTTTTASNGGSGC